MRGLGIARVAAAMMAVTLALPVNALAGEWRKDEEHWSYYQEDGQPVRNAWFKDTDERWYYADDKGVMKTGWHQDAAGRWYYLNADGAMATGWTYLDGKWYYLNAPGGEMLAGTVTPDGYTLDASGSWDGKPAEQVPLGAYGSGGSGSSGGSSGSNKGNNSKPETPGTETPGPENPGPEDPGPENPGPEDPGPENPGPENPGPEDPNPWAEEHPLDLTATGIVSVSGILYAVVAFKDGAAAADTYNYYLSGNDVTAWMSPVTVGGDVLKVPLAGTGEGTLKVTSPHGGEVIISLAAMGGCTVTDDEATGGSTVQTKQIPQLVLAKETLSLEQYLKFIKVGSGLYVKPSRTTVSPVQSLAIDAMSSATSTPPASLEGQEEEATIAILFDLVANHTIAGQAGRPGSTTEAFLAKWEELDKTLALSGDYSMCLGGSDYSGLEWQATSTEELPRYVKYLTEKPNYGTKAELLTGRTDNTNPPELTIERSMKGEDAVIQLSEENETWYRSITEIKVPYSEKDTFYYQTNHTLSEDGRTITMGVKGDGISGPMNYVGNYEVIFHSYEFADTVGILRVITDAPTFTETWDNTNKELKLRASYSYYTDRVTGVVVNGEALGVAQFRADYNSVFIPYVYLVNGMNTIELYGDGYTDVLLELASPGEFVTPKRAPGITVSEVLAIKASPIVCTVDMQEGAAEWLETLELSHIKLSDKYSPYNDLVLSKEADSFTVTSEYSTLSVYDDLTLKIEIPGYDIVSRSIKPVNETPAVTETWLDNYSLKLESDYYTYLGSTVNKLVLNGKTLEKGQSADYTVSNSDGIEIFAHNFTAGEAFTLELHAPSYQVKVINKMAPAELIQPKEVPEAGIENVCLGEDIVVTTIDGDTAWLDAVIDVQIQKSYDSPVSCEFERTAAGLKLDNSPFNSFGTYNITITATGYRLKELSFTILKTVETSMKLNTDEDRLEIEIEGDYSYASGVSVTVNGEVLKKGSGFTASGYTKIYISAELLTEDSNTVVLSNSAYRDVELTIEKYIPLPNAPELKIETPISGDKTITLTWDEIDAEWLDAMDASCIEVKYTSYSGIEVISINKLDDQIEIELESGVSNTREYTVLIAVEGYRTYSETFKPYRSAPNVDQDWLENGDLELATSQISYFNKNYLTVYLDGDELAYEDDYTYPSGYGTYRLVIYAHNFSEGEHVIRLEYSGSSSSNFAPLDIEIYADDSFGGQSLHAELAQVSELPAPELEEEELAVEEPKLDDELEAEEEDDVETGEETGTETEIETGKETEKETEAGDAKETEKETEAKEEADEETDSDTDAEAGNETEEETEPGEAVETEKETEVEKETETGGDLEDEVSTEQENALPGKETEVEQDSVEEENSDAPAKE